MFREFLPQISNKKRRRFLRHGLWLAGVGGVLALLFTVVQPFYKINLLINDQFFSAEQASPNIVIVGIDDDSLLEYGRLDEWPRSLHAQAVANLKAAGVSVIGYDVIFADSSSEDPAFAAALAQAGNVVLAGKAQGERLSSGAVPTYVRYDFPAQVFREASATGHVNVLPDPADGCVRLLPLQVADSAGNIYPSLSLAVLHNLFYMEVPAELDAVNGKLSVVGREVPVDGQLCLRLNYAENITGLPTISYADVIKGSFDASLVKGKIVLVGMTAQGLDDQAVPTSVSAVRVPGVFIHAAALDTILRESYLTELGWGTTLAIMLGLTALCAVALPAFGTRNKRDIIKVSAFVLLLAGGYLVFGALSAGRGQIVNILYPELTLAGLYVGSVLYAISQEQSDRRMVKELFGRYVSPQVSKEIVDMADSGGLRLGGEDREISVLFADIRGFTTLSEKMTPGEVVAMLNTCLPLIIDAVAAHEGMVNKFAGDCIMGVWNAPNHVTNHALLAVQAAWEAQQKMAALVQPSGITVRFGIGINTGRAIAGNLGSTGRSEYTVIGDTVNLASRICGATAGGEVWVGPDTYTQIKDSVQADALEPQTFKGKTKPVQVYRITGWR